MPIKIHERLQTDTQMGGEDEEGRAIAPDHHLRRPIRAAATGPAETFTTVREQLTSRALP